MIETSEYQKSVLADCIAYLLKPQRENWWYKTRDQSSELWLKSKSLFLFINIHQSTFSQDEHCWCLIKLIILQLGLWPLACAQDHKYNKSQGFHFQRKLQLMLNVSQTFHLIFETHFEVVFQNKNMCLKKKKSKLILINLIWN